MKVNISSLPGQPARFEDLNSEEFATWAWGRGPLPTRLTGPTLKGKPVRNEYEAYWASQPPAVQVLMDLREPELSAKAHELADAGYAIDVPIMLWNWDPLSTMVVRHNQGFTWVPSANMANIQVGPGLAFPGKPSYDAANIPAGAILVTIAWAKGFEHTSPWMQGNPPEQW